MDFIEKNTTPLYTGFVLKAFFLYIQYNAEKCLYIIIGFVRENTLSKLILHTSAHVYFFHFLGASD